MNGLSEGIWKMYIYYKDDIFESSGTFKNGKKLDDWQTIKIHSVED
jgi:antitoxin component YwqK of YwqJK toxin-antitoxin module